MTKIEKAISRLKESIFKLGATDAPSLIVPVGDDWQPFGVMEGDSAKMILREEGVCFIAYKCPKGKFAKHYHKVTESGTILKGSITVNTPDKTFTVKEGESYTLPAYEWHEVYFNDKENLAAVQFHPPFLDGEWVAEFEEN